jgi:CheY-like chemotaxis protein
MSNEKRALLAGVRVLYVDDDADTRAMMILLLGMAGATVVAVESAREALVAIRQEQPDVLVSDVGMPERDGWRFIEELRQWPSSEGGGLPAIAVTGLASADAVAHTLRSGFDVYISKPIDVSDLERSIATLVGRANGAKAAGS